MTEFALAELQSTLDQSVEDVLTEAGIEGPPVDCLLVAKALGLVVATDGRQRGRARIVHAAGTGGSILVRPEPRHERLQWAVAHEIGESQVGRVFADLGIDARAVIGSVREQIANQLAKRLLLPQDWFGKDAINCDWDLLTLKALYRTASHELIARRMLDFPPQVIITIFDNGRMTSRISNVPGMQSPLSADEKTAWQRAHSTALPQLEGDIQAWPIHEPEWKREILRRAVADFYSYE